MTKPKKRDPLAALKKMHPGPWKVEECESIDGSKKWWSVVDADGFFVEHCISHLSLARVIAKLGGGK